MFNNQEWLNKIQKSRQNVQCGNNSSIEEREPVARRRRHSSASEETSKTGSRSEESSGRSTGTTASDSRGESDAGLSATSTQKNDIGQSVSYIDGSDLFIGSGHDIPTAGRVSSRSACDQHVDSGSERDAAEVHIDSSGSINTGTWHKILTALETYRKRAFLVHDIVRYSDQEDCDRLVRDPAVYTPIRNSANLSTSSAAMISTASDTSTFCTTASGQAENVGAAVSIGTSGTILTEGLLQHAKLKQKIGCASSIIYVADSEASYKYASETRNGDIQLDFRLYKMEDVQTQNQADLWRHSIIRGKIAARSETPKGMLPDPVYTAIQNLVKAVQTAMTSDPHTEVTRLASQWKKSKE